MPRMLRASVRRLCRSSESEAWRNSGGLCRSSESEAWRNSGGLCRKQGFATVPSFDRQETVPRNPWFCKYATFFDPEIYEAARRNLAARKKAAVSDAFARITIPHVIQQMKSRSFQFQPADAEGSVTRSPFTDQLVQEAFRLILEPAFPHPGHPSAQATLQTLQRTWTGTTWAITSVSPGLLHNLDHSILGNLIMQGVQDQQLLDLYWKLVNSGHVKSSHRHNLNDVSKGGILWPLFTNIYLSKFDSWIMDYASTLSPQTLNPSPQTLYLKLQTLNPSSQTLNPVRYIRYGDQWMVGVAGPKSLAVHLREDIISHVNLTLNLQISEDFLTISHMASEKVKFLGVLVSTRDKKYTESLDPDRARRAIGRVVLEAPVNEIVSKLVDQGFAATPEFPRGMSGWIHLDADEILRRYVRITEGLREYYGGVDNVNMMRRVFWILRFSAVFTLCRKWRISSRALFRKMANHSRWGDFLKGRVTSR